MPQLSTRRDIVYVVERLSKYTKITWDLKCIGKHDTKGMMNKHVDVGSIRGQITLPVASGNRLPVGQLCKVTEMVVDFIKYRFSTNKIIIFVDFVKISYGYLHILIFR